MKKFGSETDLRNEMKFAERDEYMEKLEEL